MDGLSRRGFLRATGITTMSLWIPKLWTPAESCIKTVEAVQPLVGDLLLASSNFGRGGWYFLLPKETAERLGFEYLEISGSGSLRGARMIDGVPALEVVG